jgi:1-acyl-sn-glycerol-3-phosphate acyltransferase
LSAALVELTERPVQLRGSAIARAVLRLAGWEFHFDGMPSRQGVAVFYPHTSNWDFVMSLLGVWSAGVPLSFFVKHSLFRIPLFGRWLRSVGGLPVVRSARQGAVAQMAEQLRLAKQDDRFLWLGISPEGTRTLTSGWRTGFYRIARQADVPLCLISMDYGRRRLAIDSCWRLSGDMPADFAVFAGRLAGVRGHRPQHAAPVRPLES